MNWWSLGYECRLRLALVRRRLEMRKMSLERWYYNKKLCYLSWQVQKLEQLNTLAESYEFQRGENDE